MRKLLLFLALALNLYSAKSQDSTISKNKFETFSSQTGVLFKTVEEQIDKVKDIKLFIITTTNVETGEELKALHITKNANSFFGPMVLQSFTIDWEEIKGFTSALKYIKKQTDVGKPKMQTYFRYTTTNGGVISASYIKGAYASGWKLVLAKEYKYSRSTITGSEFELKNKNIDELIESIDELSNRK